MERQLDRKVKIFRLDRGGEYYGKYDESGQHPGSFAKFPEKRGICAQYTMPCTPQQNGVSERRNQTLMDMVRSMGVNGSLRLNVTLMEISNVIRPDLFPKVLLKRMALIIKKDFHLFLRKIPLKLSSL